MVDWEDDSALDGYAVLNGTIVPGMSTCCGHCPERILSFSCRPRAERYREPLIEAAFNVKESLETMATRQKLPATLAVAALTTTLYGCGGGGDSRFVDLEEQLGTALTAESLKKLQDERDAARAAQMTAEAERDAANMAKMTAEAAQMTAEAAQRDAEAAQRTAEAAQRDAEAAQRDAEAAQRTAEAAQRDAEVDRDAANMAKMTAEAAQRDAEAAQRTAEAAQRDAEAERDAANMAKMTAEAAQRDAEAAQRDAEVDRDAANMAKMTAEAAQRDAAEAAQRTAEAAQRDAEAERDAANMAKMTAEAAQRDAEAAQRTAEAAQRDAEADRDAANMAKTTAEAAQRDAEAAQRDAEMALKALQDKMDAQMLEEEREGRVAMVEAVRLAVSNDRVGSISNDLPFSSDPNASRNSDGMVMIGLDAAITNDGSFPDGSAAAGAVWTGVGLMRDRSMTNSASNKSDTIMVYTDVEAPMDVELLKSEGSTAGSVEFVLITETSGRIRHMELANPPPATGAELVYQNSGEFDGMYRGIPGTFRCVGGSCGITKRMNSDGEDELVFLSGSGYSHSNRLRFTPDDDEATYSADDMKYTYFGWWLEKGVAGDPEQTEKLQPFHGGVGNTANVDMALTGTARYEGQARGKYVTTSYTAGDLTDGQHGLFEATAMLTADFGDATSPGNISGEVNNFDTGAGGVDSTGWSVTLRGMGAAAAANLTDGSNTAAGMTDVLFGSFNHEGAGSWEASFHDPGEDPSSDAPGTITGIFDAVVRGVGLLTGGFGAKLDMPPAEQ